MLPINTNPITAQTCTTLNVFYDYTEGFIDVTPILTQWIEDAPQEESENRKIVATRLKEFLDSPSATELHLDSLILSSLPKVFQHEEFKQRLQVLNLNNNRLTALIPEIGDLQALEYLDLSNNQLAELPEEIGNLGPLKSLKLCFNPLRTLIPEIGSLLTLNELDLSSLSNLTGIPQELLDLQPYCEIELTGTRLSPSVLTRLQDACDEPDYQGPRISFSMPEAHQAEDEKSIEESLATLFEAADMENRTFPTLCENITANEALRSWLGRLTWMQDYKTGGECRMTLAKKILAILDLAEKDSVFREEFFAKIDGAARTCGDRIALSLLHLGLAHKLATLDLTDMKEVANLLIKGVWTLEQLEQCAREKILDLPFFDEIEVYLGYPIRLKQRLELPIDVEGMLYFACSSLTDADLEAAATFVENSLGTEDARCKILIQHNEWKKALKHNYQEELATIEKEKDTSMTKAINVEDYTSIERSYEEQLIKLTKQALDNASGIGACSSGKRQRTAS